MEPQYASASASYLPRARVYSSNLRRYSAMAAGDGAVIDAAGRSAASALAARVNESSNAASTHPQHLWSEPCRISSAVLAERTSREVVQVEKPHRVTPKNLLFIGCGDYQSVHDVDVLSGIDRHRAVIGAEHDVIGAEHLHRLAHVRRPEAHGVDVKLGEIIARPLLAANDGALGHALAAEPPTKIEPSDSRQKPATHMCNRDLHVWIAVEQPRQDHACERHRGIERPPDQFIELVLIHLLLVSYGHARRMDEDRYLPRLRPFPEREGVFRVDELAVPARRDQQPLEAERAKTALALGDVACISGLSVPRPQLLFARATTAAVRSLTCLTTSIAGLREIAVITSAANGLLMIRPVMPALAQTSCWRSKSVMSW